MGQPRAPSSFHFFLYCGDESLTFVGQLKVKQTNPVIGTRMERKPRENYRKDSL